MTREEKIKDLLHRIEESNKPKSRRKGYRTVSREQLERRSMERACSKIKALRKANPNKEYEIQYVDVVEHERQMECGMVTVCAHKRAMVVRIK